MDKGTLEEGLIALGLHHDDTVMDRFQSYATLLKKWGKVYNLTTLLTDEAIVSHHFLDSAALVPVFASFPQAKRVLDVGSGGGLPSIPLAILRPDLTVHAVDAVAKKIAFLTQVGIQLKLTNYQAKHTRVEQFQGSYDVITSRAFASLYDFVEWTQHLLAPSGVWLAMKAGVPEEEIAQLPSTVRVKSIVTLDVPYLNEQRHVIILEKTAG